MFRKTSAGRDTRRAGTVAVLIAVAASLTACGHDRTDAARVPPPTAAQVSMPPPVAVAPTLRTAIEQRVATRMRLDPARIRAQLLTDPDATLMTLAKPVGLAQDQLATLILYALRDGADTAIRSGTWTARQANQDQQFWTAQAAPDLIAEISNWFRES